MHPELKRLLKRIRLPAGYRIIIRRRRRKPSAPKKYLKHKEEARKLVKEKVKMLNEYYGFKHGKIAIRNQRSRWGSCSMKGNLNFNYKIVFLPEALQDYLIVHELCHLKEFNHSKAFWELVRETIPDYKTRRLRLKHWHESAAKAPQVAE